MNWSVYSKKAPYNSDKVDYMEFSWRNLIYSSAEPVRLLFVYMSAAIFGNKFKEKTQLLAE